MSKPQETDPCAFIIYTPDREGFFPDFDEIVNAEDVKDFRNGARINREGKNKKQKQSKETDPPKKLNPPGVAGRVFYLTAESAENARPVKDTMHWMRMYR